MGCGREMTQKPMAFYALMKKITENSSTIFEGMILSDFLKTQTICKIEHNFCLFIVCWYFTLVLLILCVFYVMSLDPINYPVPLHLPFALVLSPNKTKFKGGKRDKMKNLIMEAAV